MVREFKRRIGDSVPLAVGGDSWLAPEDVYARMARWVVDRAEEREGSAPSSIIMTHPAAWGGSTAPHWSLQRSTWQVCRTSP